MLEHFINLITSFLSGIAVHLIGNRFGRDNKEVDTVDHMRESRLISSVEGGVKYRQPISHYAISVGQKHVLLRHHLGLELPDLVSFYEVETVSELEFYEAGLKELPLSFIRKLEDYFFLDSHFFKKESDTLFRKFTLSKENIKIFLSEGFLITIVCNPQDREDLLCRIVLSKEEDNFMRMIVSDLEGSFASNGGGCINIHYAIHAMIEMNMPWWDSRIFIRNSTPLEWIQLMRGDYYNKRLFITGFVDRECREIFVGWYRSAVQSRMMFESAFNVESLKRLIEH